MNGSGSTDRPESSSPWSRYGAVLLWPAVLYMVVSAVGKLVYAAPYLVGDPAPWAALDLEYRYAEVQRWFAAMPVYGELENADYPPASYVILWPLLGWLPLEAARWLWAATTALAAGVLAWIFVRESGARTWPQRLFAGLIVFSAYPLQHNIFVGQLGVHVLAAVIAGLVWLRATGRARWRDALGASMLIVVALVKPTLSAPFVWLACITPSRWRPVVTIGVTYVALSAIAAAAQGAGLPELLASWLAQTGVQTTPLEGTANVHRWLAILGLENWGLPISLLTLAAAGAWVIRHRDADPWILLGVAALTARLWVHHRPYDDILLLVPMVTLLRLTIADGRVATMDSAAGDRAAGVLLALFWAALHLPTFAFYGENRLLILTVEAGQSVLWIATLVYLLARARRDTGRPAANGVGGSAVGEPVGT